MVRFAAPAAVPRFYVHAERLTHSALINNIRALGKRCAVTEYGQGVRCGTIKIRKVVLACKKSVSSGNAQDWQYALCADSDGVLRAFSDGKRAAKHSAYCGHVGKYPCVFLFCERFVRDCGCDITEHSLFDAISAFEENAEFTLAERKILCGMLRLCLIGYLYSTTESASKLGDEYDDGVADGARGKVSLDYINADDYVCGLIQSCTENERPAVQRLLEYNGVDIGAADSRRRKRLAQAYLTVNSVLRSLSVVAACENKIYAPQKHGGVKVKRYVKAFNIIFPILIVAYAVLACVFASQRFVALFSVATIITYAIMRIPVLLHSPTSGIDILYPIEALFRKRASKKNDTTPSVNSRRLLAETAYFGCEPQYANSVIDGSDIRVCCDNRGEIAIEFGSAVDGVYIGVTSDGVSITLSECDGVIEPHRAVYRACKGDLEVCAQAIAPIDGNLCLVRLTVINRGAYDKSATITGAVVRKFPRKQKCYTQNIRGGATVVCDNGFALALSGGEYGGDLRVFCADGTMVHGNIDSPALMGVTTLSVKGFSIAVAYMTIVYAPRTQAENVFEYVSDDLYYDRAVESAAIYCKPNATENHAIVECVRYGDRKNDVPPTLLPPSLPKYDCEYALPFGGISMRQIVIKGDRKHAPINNTISGGNLRVSLNQFGVQNIAVGRDSLTASADEYTYTPRAFVMIGESGVIWSPTKAIDANNMRTVHGHGYTEYTRAYNGMVCVQKVFAVPNASAIFFDITLFNKTDEERNINIMFSALCDSAVNTEICDNRVTVTVGKTKLALIAVDETAEYAAYKEGYFVYGKVDRTSAFRAGGSTPAPTAAVRKAVGANDNVRVVFCIADERTDKPNRVDGVDNAFNEVRRFFGRLGRILPATDDGVLNISYMQALYGAYCAFAAGKRASLYSESFVLSAAKYVSPNAVKDRLYRILSEQNQNGLLGLDYFDCLQTARCIIEYAEYTKDDGFWNEVLPYAPLRIHGKMTAANGAVSNHILQAVKYLIDTSMPSLQSLVQSVWQCKSLLYVFRFADNKYKLSGDLHELYKRRFTQIANEYALLAKRLTSNSLYRFRSATEAYLCARLLFDLDADEQAYNILKYNNPIERGLHYGDNADYVFDCFSDSIAAAVYFTTVTERLFGVRFMGRTLKICPHTARNTPQIAFDILGKSNDVRVTVDGGKSCGNWKMRVNKINYPADSVDIRNLSDDIVFYRDGD
ncbi:MAG: hypothetical protein K2F90_04850 [Clostridiales bacterium]|nr:hypothetical protein [Clostridiales bacterium]